jgi:hypothetical protein
MHRWRLVLATLVAVPGAAVGAAAGADSASVTVGQNGTAGTISMCGVMASVLYVQDAVASGAPYTTPAGVVTSWTVVVPSGPGTTVKLKTVHEGPADTYTIQRSSEAVELAAIGPNTFISHIPVAAGDAVALWAVSHSGVPCAFTTGQAGDRLGGFLLGTEPRPGESYPFVFNSGSRLNVSATVEPDADGDGFGDVTQDQCPAHAGSSGDCQPPETGFGKVKKRITTAGSRARVKLPLTSTEPATFTCSVDGRKPKQCTSPYRLRLAPGRHYVYVTSTDAAGNTDVTAATLRLRVVRRG